MQMRHFRVSIILASVLLLSSCTAVPIDTPNAGSYASQTNAVDQSAPFNRQPSVETECPVLNADAANTTVAYTSKEKGISFDTPYNEHWGYAGHVFPAYTQMQIDDMHPLGFVEFGPPHVEMQSEGSPSTCDLMHSYELTFLPFQSAAAVKHEIEGQDSAVVPNTQTRVINGFTVVQYTGVGLFKNPTMVVVGDQYGSHGNYRFETTFGEDTPEEWSYLENIVKSIQFQ